MADDYASLDPINYLRDMLLLIMIYRRKIAFVYDSENECKTGPLKVETPQPGDCEIATHSMNQCHIIRAHLL